MTGVNLVRGFESLPLRSRRSRVVCRVLERADCGSDAPEPGPGLAATTPSLADPDRRAVALGRAAEPAAGAPGAPFPGECPRPAGRSTRALRTTCREQRAPRRGRCSPGLRLRLRVLQRRRQPERRDGFRPRRRRRSGVKRRPVRDALIRPRPRQRYGRPATPPSPSVEKLAAARSSSRTAKPEEGGGDRRAGRGGGHPGASTGLPDAASTRGHVDAQTANSAVHGAATGVASVGDEAAEHASPSGRTRSTSAAGDAGVRRCWWTQASSSRRAHRS